MTLDNYMTIITYGIAAGFSIGFISWAIGFVIYSMIKFFKLGT